MASLDAVTEYLIFQVGDVSDPILRLDVKASTTGTTLVVNFDLQNYITVTLGLSIKPFFLNLEPVNGYIETVLCTGVTTNQLTVVRGIDLSGLDFGGNAALGVEHESGSVLKTNVNAGLLQMFLSAHLGTINSVVKFGSVPLWDITKTDVALSMPIYADATARDASITTPIEGMKVKLTTEGVISSYIGSAWISEGTSATPNASPTVAGKGEVGTSTESKAGTDTGGTGAFLWVLPSDIAKNEQNARFVYAADGGIADAYSVNLTPAMSTLTTGSRVRFKAGNANTGASTFVLNGSPALAIKTRDGLDPAAGDIQDDELIDLVFDQTSLIWVLQKTTMFHFGDGSDGDLVVTTDLSGTPLTRDMYYNDLTISGSGQLNDPAGYKIYVKGTFTNSATAGISRDGNTGSGQTSSVALAQGSLNAERVGGNGGGAGSGNGGSGTAGSPGEASNPGYHNVNGNAGGTGGNPNSGGSPGTGGAGGVATRGPLYNFIFRTVKKLMSYFVQPASGPDQLTQYLAMPGGGGGGGGGGSSDGPAFSGGVGGGAGGNGGMIWIAAKEFNNTGTITAIGGDGHDGGIGGGGGGQGGGGGGGSGGSGGIVTLIYSTLTSLGTITLTGGSGGAGGIPTTTGNPGSSGSAGSAGTTIQIAV